MTKEELQSISDLIQPINDRLDKMNNRLNRLEQGQTKLEVTIENQVERAIKTITEGHTDLYRKVEENLALESRVETLEHKVSAVEYVLKKAE